MKRLLEALLLPPMHAVVLVLLGLLVRRRRPRLGLCLTLLGVLSLWALATPVVAGCLLGALQRSPALAASGPLPAAGAIVVLSAEADREGAEFGGATVGAYTLQRLRYAAALARRSGLPVLTSGGRPTVDTPPLAELMARTLEQDFQVPVRWREDRSADTWENAVRSAELLRQEQVDTVLLVTHAWHMPRAAASFAAQGLKVVPAPTVFRGPAWRGWSSLLPAWGALRDSSLALHEWIGRGWYWLRHGA